MPTLKGHSENQLLPEEIKCKHDAWQSKRGELLPFISRQRRLGPGAGDSEMDSASTGQMRNRHQRTWRTIKFTNIFQREEEHVYLPQMPDPSRVWVLTSLPLTLNGAHPPKHMPFFFLAGRKRRRAYQIIIFVKTIFQKYIRYKIGDLSKMSTASPYIIFFPDKEVNAHETC